MISVKDQETLFQAVLNPGDIILEDDILLTSRLNLNTDIHLDLNGKLLSTNVRDSIVINSGAKVSIENGKIVNYQEDGLIVSDKDTELTLGENLKLESENCILTVQKKGKCIIEGAELSCNGDYAVVFVTSPNSYLDFRCGSITSGDQPSISAKSGSKVLISGGEIRTSCESKSYSEIYLDGRGTRLDMTGGVIISQDVPAISINNTSKAYISGGRVESNSSNFSTIHVIGDKSSLHIFDNAYVGGHFCGIYSQCGEDESTEIVITGGFIDAPANRSVLYIHGDCNLTIQPGLKVHGVFSGDVVGYTLSDPDEDGNRIVQVVEYDDTQSDVDVTDDDEDDYEEDSDDDIENDEPVEIVRLNSVLLKKSVPVYASPSLSHKIDDIVGAITVLNEIKGNDGKLYLEIRYKLPGSGRAVKGYIIK